MIVVKNQTVIDCLQSDTKTPVDEKNDVISEKLVHCIFICWVILKTWQGENDGYSWKN